MSDDPAELERFYAETIQPLADYDEQYETELVTRRGVPRQRRQRRRHRQQLFTHRHTVRYRLERVRELCGHDISSTEGREKLGLGLEAMRVLGISSPAARRSSPAPAAEVAAPAKTDRRPRSFAVSFG